MKHSNTLLCFSAIVAAAGTLAQEELNCGPFPADPDPCVFEARVTMPIERTIQCLDALNLTATDMQKQKDNNIGYLHRLLDGVYSFADLQENTTDTPGAALNDLYQEAPFSWSQYNYSVPWRQTLSEILNDTINTNLYDYTAQITQMMKKFQDAHTQMEALENVFPFHTFYPFMLMSRMGNETGEQEIYFVEDADSELYNNKSRECGWPGYEVVPETLLEETIVTVNGVTAKDFFSKYAEQNGNYKNSGGRFNSLLVSGLGRNTLFTPGFRQNYNDTTLNVEFASGATAVVKPLTLALTKTRGVDDILLTGTSPRTDFNKAVVAYYEGEPLNTTESSDGRVNITVPDNAPGSPLNPNPLETNPLPFNDNSEEANTRRRRARDMMAAYAEQKAKRRRSNPTIHDLDIQEIQKKLWRNRRQGPLNRPDDESVDPSEMESDNGSEAAPSETAGGEDAETDGSEDLSEAASETDVAVETEGESGTDGVSESDTDSGRRPFTLKPLLPFFTLPKPDIPEPEPNTPSQHLIFLNDAGAIYNYSGVPVMRYPSFFSGNDPEQFIVDTLDLLDILIDTFATIRNGNERLVIDISGNGGGLTILPNVMVDILSGGTKDIRQCPVIDIREGPVVTSWVNMTQFPPPEMLRVDDDELEEFISDMEVTVEFLEHVAPDELEKVQFLITNAATSSIINNIFYKRVLNEPELLRDLSPRDRAVYVNTFRSVVTSVIAIPPPLWSGISPINMSPFNLNPYHENGTKQEAIDPTQFWFTESNNFTRGGIENNYSMKVVECLYDLLVLAPQSSIRSFSDILLITDGTCGSACGQFINAMQAIGNGAYPDLQPFNSTIVGFGGFVDEPLSMNAFEGGNVLSDEDFLFDLYVNGAILGPLYTGIGPDKEVLAEQYKKILQGVPIPYNNGLLIRFNYRESYLNGAGEAALPTEFYQKPTTVHLEEWHPLLSSTAYGMFNEGVNSLYTRMAAGDLTTNAVPSPVPANPEPAQSASRDDLDEMSDTLDPSSAVATAGASGAGSEESGDATDLDPMESSV